MAILHWINIVGLVVFGLVSAFLSVFGNWVPLAVFAVLIFPLSSLSAGYFERTFTKMR